MNLGKEQMYKEINKILWNDWDPLGVNDYGGPNDEYESYVPQLFLLKSQNADIEIMSKELDEIATKQMGLTINNQHSKEIAQKILEIN